MSTPTLAVHLKKRTNKATNHLNRKINGTFKKSKRGKYNASGRYIDDHWFPSKAEGDRYEQLREMVKLGTIFDLELQPAFKCIVNGVLIYTHRADFRYKKKLIGMGRKVLIEDVKGMVTKEYKVVAKLMKALHPDVQITLLPGKAVAKSRYLTVDEAIKTETTG